MFTKHKSAYLTRQKNAISVVAAVFNLICLLTVPRGDFSERWGRILHHTPVHAAAV